MNDITARLAKAGAAFGKLHQRLWREHGVSLATKVALQSTSHHYCTDLRPGLCIGIKYGSLISSTCAACAALLASSGKTGYQILES